MPPKPSHIHAASNPRNDRITRRCFELLKRAYVEARYSKHYKITEEELAGCVERLIEVVEGVCRWY